MISTDEAQESQEDGQPPEAPLGPAPLRRHWLWIAPLRRHWLWIAVCLAVGLAALASAIMPGSSNALAPLAGTQLTAPGAAAGPAGSSTAAPNPDATEPVPVPSSAKLSTAPHLPRKLAASLARWDAGRGGAGLTAVLNDLGNATQNDGLKLYAAMRRVCLTVSPAVATARASPPIPDATMQTWYAKGLASLAKAAVDCRAGISVQANGEESVQTEEIPAVLHRSESEFVTAAKELYRATAKIKALKNR